jgi:hypothetical protein
VVRRALAAAVLGISLWVGSLAWTGFLLLRTVLDPGRSRSVAEALYEDEQVRAQLVDGIADSVAASLPPGTPLPRDAVESTATAALDSPAVEALFVDALARTHAAFLGEGRPPDSVDPGALGAAARDTVVARNPGLDAVLPASPELAVPLPTERVPNLGPVRDLLAATVPLLALLSVTGIALALLVTSNRPAIIRRAGVWAIGLAAFVLVFAYGIPALATQFAPGQAAVIAALVRAMAETTRGPALALGAVGALAVVGSMLWRGKPAAAPARTARRPVRGVAHPPPPRTRSRPVPAAGGRTPRTRLPDGYAPGARQAEPAPTTRVTRGPVAPTTVQGSPSAPPAAPSTSGGGSVDPTGVEGGERRTRWAEGGARRTRWVEGVGWVLEGSSAIPPDARWVPGVGYVVDDR